MCTNDNHGKRLSNKHFSLKFLSNRVKRFFDGNKEFMDDYKDAFSVTGGEPTLNPEFIKIINKINSFFPGIRICLLTNGRMFSYERFARDVLSQNIKLELCISIHGHTPDLHDKITQTKNSFRQAISGIENILRFRKPNQILEIRIVMHRLNYKYLSNILRFVKFNISQADRVVLLFMELEGQAVRNFKTTSLTYYQLKPYLVNSYDLISSISNLRLYHFPLCTLPVDFFPFIWRTLPSFEVDFLKSCFECSLKEFCLGVHKGYLKLIGSAEFKPIKKNIKIKTRNNWHHPIIRLVR
jgi:sulfatase maturation enzyme AslB (radical SAM superfamily)